MDPLEYWIKANALNIYQLALLTEGYNPSDYEDQPTAKWPHRVKESITVHIAVLRNAVATGGLEPLRVALYGNGDTNWYDTLLSVHDYRLWLETRGLTGTIFHKGPSRADDFANPFGAFYVPKLAAAVDAWKAVTADPKRWRGKSPKKALEAWLRENAATYGLLNKDGSPNMTGIEEIAKVANWKPTGGAPATPATASLPQVHTEPSLGFGETPAQISRNPTEGSELPDLDDDLTL